MVMDKFGHKKTAENFSGFFAFGGAEEDRTPDLRIANASLSHLSYGPQPEADRIMGKGKPFVKSYPLALANCGL